VTATDIRASNGVVHVIDGLLTPSLNLAEVGLLNGLTTLLELAVEAELDDEVTDPAATLTVFAPTNEAFAALSEVPTGDALVQVLQYHVLQAIRESGSFFDGEVLATALTDASLTVNITEDAVTLTDGQGNTVNVSSVDIPANNGIIHVIEAVLLPPPPPAP
jgi:transforming growth factor-beta-induced protein